MSDRAFLALVAAGMLAAGLLIGWSLAARSGPNVPTPVYHARVVSV